MLAPDQAYARLAPVYDEIDNPVTFLGLEQIRRIGPMLRGREVLDLGCGTGAPARRASQFGPRNWVGVDRAIPMLQRFGETAAGADFETLPFAGASFDIVLFWLSLGYVDSPGPALLESARVLRPGGELFILDIHPAGKDRNWKRNIGGISIRSAIHSRDAWTRAFEAAGLEVASETVILVDEAIRPFFERAGMNFRAVRGQELLIAYRLRKPATEAQIHRGTENER